MEEVWLTVLQTNQVWPQQIKAAGREEQQDAAAGRSRGAKGAAEKLQKMANTQRSWIAFAALVVCLLACWSSFADAYPPKPESPGSNASPEDWDKYQAAVRHYVNLITRQRYGKRSSVEEQAMAWLLFGKDSNQNPEPQVEDSDQW